MAKNIMFMGTGSSVGKSLLTAALCRILNNNGYTVAPYKSQNMALNSFITKDGKEMGRAQVVQAECARMEPQVEMNPVLLKPNSDMGAQVILMGKAAFNMDAMDYHAHKPKLVDIVVSAYDSLAEGKDIIVIEGAGSPAEINLRDNDIVNMGLAELVDAPVILIGDIDKGGVFASIYGTIMLLEPEEKKRIKGFVINKFRGDVELLKPGIEMIEEKINIPCLGVIPYKRFVIDDEDSVTERFDNQSEGLITIGVVYLPHLSNFTDCTAFEMHPDVKVEYYRNQRELQLANPDLLVIPGTKNTIDDTGHLIESKMADEIRRMHDCGVPIVGICGGYQLLGKEIRDPLGIESNKGSIEGLGLLNIVTTIGEEKRTVRTTGKVQGKFMGMELLDMIVEGYEIHMGESEALGNSKSFAILEDGTVDGVIAEDGTVMGTYLHGIFDNDDFREKIIEAIRAKKNLEAGPVAFDFKAFKEEQYDLLAETVETNLNMKKIMEILEK
ncbi:cobyric acid synthase [Acetobacterium paludosum]|uniref:Cobyric acid synthase n=1 Tax=Acetobacterium paludosum TaxID=52693 RepID=A0A923KVC6_9FIRM|nr:cobyric acid synthase [Acetobacterium paludosum]MBC3886848.1 cobyric acid synthase [Acetobacterium paludosum]